MLSDLYIRLRSLFRRNAVDAELDDELRFHLEEQVAKYIRSGLTAEDARRRARLEFGGLSQVREDCHEARGVTFLETVAQDVRFGLRMLRRSPGFTAVVVATLALGIGANTAIFSLVNAVLLRSMPVQNPNELAVLQWSAHSWPSHIGTSSYGDCDSVRAIGGATVAATGCSLSPSMFKELSERKDIFSSAMAFAGPSEMDLSGNGRASAAFGELVSGSYFETLGVRAALGRTLLPGDDKPGAAPAAVLDYAYWQSAFGGASDVVGRTIRLNNVVFTIVGVADPHFTRLTPGKTVSLWVPLSQIVPLGLRWGGSGTETAWWLTVVGRLQPGVSLAQAHAALDTWFLHQVMDSEAAHGPKPIWKKSDDPHLTLLPAQKGLVGIREQFGEPLLLLMAVVGIVLLIACANVAGLMLARGAAREKEMAVRLAVGAGRRRVIRQLLTESLLLSFAGAALGVVIAYAGVNGLAAFLSNNFAEQLRLELRPDATVLLFTVGAALLTGIGFGLAPAFRGARANVATDLKGNSTSISQAGHGTRRFGLGSALVVLQVALSMVVLTAAGLLLRTLDKLHGVDPGFDTRNVLLFSLEPQLAGYKKDRIPDLYANLQRQLAALPGVVNVTYSSGALLDGSYSAQDVHIQGQGDSKSTAEVQLLSVGPDFFSTMKIPALAGRMLSASDMGPTQRSALVNRAFVEKYAGGKNPIGLHFGGTDPDDPQWEVVGVVGDTMYVNLRVQKAPTAYLPLTRGGATFELRTASSPALLMPAVKDVVDRIDNNLPVLRMQTQLETIDQLLFGERLVARLFGLFGVLGLALACTGLYGLLSYEVARRTREIGIRTALGARRRDVWLLVLRQGVILVAVGGVIGAGASLTVTRLLHSLLYNVRPTDLATFTAVTAILLAVGAIACLLPARRATRVDPMVALRCE